MSITNQLSGLKPDDDNYEQVLSTTEGRAATQKNSPRKMTEQFQLGSRSNNLRFRRQRPRLKSTTFEEIADQDKLMFYSPPFPRRDKKLGELKR